MLMKTGVLGEGSQMFLMTTEFTHLHSQGFIMVPFTVCVTFL